MTENETNAPAPAVVPDSVKYISWSAVLGPVIPLILWLCWKDSDELANKVGKSVVNTQLTFLIYFIVIGVIVGGVIGFILGFIIPFIGNLVSFVIPPVLMIAFLVYTIIQAVAHCGGKFDYICPFAFKLIK